MLAVYTHPELNILLIISLFAFHTKWFSLGRSPFNRRRFNMITIHNKSTTQPDNPPPTKSITTVFTFCQSVHHGLLNG